jgi:squalene-hopene/tetraprenyl-beta-curcumene cyclase
MKFPFASSLALLAVLSSSFAAEPIPRRPENVSLRNEVQLAINKGLAWLKEQQRPDGSFANPENAANAADHPALTALPLIAFQREPSGRYLSPTPEFMEKGYDFLRKHVQPDGGIYAKGLSNYNTAVTMMALLNTRNPKDEPIITAARKFVVGQQASGLAKSELDGGFGYGPTGASPKRQHPDLDNTLISLEALRAYRAARPNAEIAKEDDLNWDAAIAFISRTQNLPGSNPMPWASDDPQNKGGFIYYPGFSNAGEETLPNGRVALRSYGTMTYGGLLSFIYADLKPSDPRVAAALDWLRKNYTLEENPGMGRQGLYYYYHLMAKGLASAGVGELETAEGKKIDWTRELALKLINLQNGNGSWVNDTARWMEKDPVLVTAYSVLALELIYQQL